MAAITLSYEEKLSLGSRDAVVAKTTAIDDTNTWVTGLSVVEHVSMTNGASGQTGGCTISGGTVTFKLSGSWANAMLLAIGFK